jgi:hypothetical protein
MKFSMFIQPPSPTPRKTTRVPSPSTTASPCVRSPENFGWLSIVTLAYIAQIRAIETSKVLRKLW